MKMQLSPSKKNCRTEVLSELTLNHDAFISNLFAKSDKSSIPLSGSFELTSRCPLNCRMCYIHRKENDCRAIGLEKDTEWWLRLAEEARNAGMLMLLLTGGEPLLRKDFEEIYLGAKKLGLLLSVNTNGVLINDKKIKLFADNPPQRLNITLYGTSEETYSALCGNGEAYSKTVNAIKELKKAGVAVKINYSITPYNSGDSAEAYDFAKSLGIPIQSVSYIFSPVRAYGDAVRLSAEDAAKANFEWRRRVLGDEDMRKFIRFRQGASEDFCGERINCRAALSTFWVTWDGLMTPCGMMTSPSVEIKNFSSAWQYLTGERQKILLPKECGECPLRKNCDMCAAVSMAECGRADSVPPYACKKAHEYQKLCNDFLSGQ